MIKNKQQFFQHQKMGYFNSPKYWQRVKDIETKKTICARNKVTPCSKTYYRKTLKQIKNIFKNKSERNYIFLEEPPEERLIQGEFTFLNANWYLDYNTLDGPLGTAMGKEHNIVAGLHALSILKQHLDKNTFDDFFSNF